MLAGLAVYRLEHATRVLRFCREWIDDAPDDLMVILGLRQAAPLPAFPADIHGAKVLNVIVCYSGDPEAGERVIKQLKGFQTPDVDLIMPRPYTQMQSMLDAGVPAGLCYYWKSSYLAGLDDAAIDAAVGYTHRITSPKSQVLIAALGRAVSRTGEEDTAFGHRAAPYNLNIQAAWDDPTESEAHIQWARDFWEAMQPSSTGGVYVDFLGNEGEERVRAAYGAQKYERLVKLKDRYDPGNVFSLNQNVRPSAVAPHSSKNRLPPG